MTDPIDSGSLRVERGHASPEELAALIAVLFARAGAAAETPITATIPSAARWRRSERVYLFDAPRVWHAYERVAG